MSNEATPIISRQLPDGTLIELIYDPAAETTALAVAAPGQAVRIVSDYTLPTGERVIPYSPTNNLIATGCVLFPSAVGGFRDTRDLVEDIRRYLRKYVDLSPVFETLAAHYVLLTWVYDAFNELPYLRFRGDFGTGKTRALITIGSICYKPFIASGASTVSPIFHVLDRFGGTLVLDEADFRFSDATAELTKILNNGNARGLPVLRTMTNRHRELNPTAFRIYGPKIVGMRESFSDAALESRFLTEETGTRPLRANIPIHLPGSLASEARELRNSLLAWRFAVLSKVGPDPSRLVPGLSPRLNQTALSLLSLIDEPEVREQVAGYLHGEQHSQQTARQATYDARAVRAIDETFSEAIGPTISIADVAKRFNESGELFHIPLNNKAVGALVRKLGLETKKSRGVYVLSQSERAKLIPLRAKFGIPTGASEDAVSDTTA